MTVHLCYYDVHARPGFDNNRADWISKVIQDVNPDVVVNGGDNADLPSLSSYDKGLRHFYNRNYREDIDAHLDFDERVWGPIRKRKKKLPKRIFIHGNHEYRIEKALEKSPELQNTMSLNDLDLNRNYDVIVPYRGYGTPGIHEEDGISYSHYVVAGISGRPLSSLHQGYQLVQKYHKSFTVGHQHVFSYDIQSVGPNKAIHGLSMPCMVDYEVDWSGETQNLWQRGIVIKRNVEDGEYDLQIISLDSLRKEYGK